MVIAKIDDELSCHDHNKTDDTLIDALFGSLALLVMMMSGYVLFIHLLFKELRTLFGKLLMLYSLSIVSMSGTLIALLLMHKQIVVNSQIICHTVMIICMVAHTWVELSATNILTHLAYIMYRCYQLKSEISNKRSNFY